MRHFIDFGSKRIYYTLEYKARKSLGITVTPEMEVLVKAPIAATLTQVNEKVRKRAPWILKQQSFFLSYYPKTPPRKFVSGESHLYLGKQYRLRVLTGVNGVKLAGGFMVVTCADKSKAKQVLKAWYLKQAKIKFELLAKKWILRFKKYDKEPESIVIREMPTRWGSCTPQNKIILNPELIKAPTGCIEYVIVHELCHLVYRNHTAKFMALQNKELPGWQKWKDKLEKVLT